MKKFFGANDENPEMMDEDEVAEELEKDTNKTETEKEEKKFKREEKKFLKRAEKRRKKLERLVAPLFLIITIIVSYLIFMMAR